MNAISIIGAGGLTGRELLKLLNHHPEFEVVHITSNQLAGKRYQESYPMDRFHKELVFQKHESSIPKGSTVVLATPNEVSLEMAPKLLDAGHKVIDLSGAYRLHDQEIFEKAYKLKHTHWDRMNSVVFGIPELYREKIKNSQFVSNPGCYSTASLLPVRLLDSNCNPNAKGIFSDINSTLVIDAKSGVSGAGGRTEDVGFSFTNTYENFRAYKILSHQHEPEIREYGLGIYENGRKDLDLIFTPHLLPIYRGILATIYIQTKSADIANSIPLALEQACESEIFLRYKNTPELVEIKNVQNTNYLDLSARVRGNNCVIVSALDNLLKGAAGQALQNLNLMHGLEEEMGLL
ncbi:MAG: N-acetyl-gamma-glutamyl-phosphate reductase [Leptospira sp.]|nr:N-acetyl-gamma-glutamyl-phosphate reductase [Leptospira sp.]